MSNAPQAGEPTMEEILASIRRIISEEEAEAPNVQPVNQAKDEPEPEPEPEEDILELTDMVAEPEPEPEPQPRPRPTLVRPVDDVVFAAEPEPSYPEPDEGIVANAVADQATAAFDMLHRNMAISHTAVGASLEGLVRELLKPLLKQWLDSNLPEIVERVVRDEVERVANRRR